MRVDTHAYVHVCHHRPCELIRSEILDSLKHNRTREVIKPRSFFTDFV